jgi:lysophospholipase L1-like esterase
MTEAGGTTDTGGRVGSGGMTGTGGRISSGGESALGTGGGASGGSASAGTTGTGGAAVTGGRGGGESGGMTGSGGSSSDGGIDGPSTTGGRWGTGGQGGTGGGAAGAGGGTMAVMPCPTTGDCKVMPVGDSITWKGYCDGAYRADLFKLALTDAKHMTFVGRQKDGPDNVTVGGTTTPFPKNHEGYSGYTIDSGGGRTGISTLIDAALTTNPPHIVLLMIGTNDVDNNLSLSTAPDRLGALMDRITTGAPNALLVVAQIVPTQSATINTRVETYNSAIPGLVQSRVAAGKHIAMVDMYGAFVANPNYATDLMTDRLHPNQAGCMVMAMTWYDGIKSYLP